MFQKKQLPEGSCFFVVYFKRIKGVNTSFNLSIINLEGSDNYEVFQTYAFATTHNYFIMSYPFMDFYTVTCFSRNNISTDFNKYLTYSKQ